nr:malonyl-coenzyme A:anthocyanin 3-O-glucoside-6''-O-malonyltransferase-like [Tanacetum cinerariifolium]
MQIATTKNMLTILESCQISPPPATIGNRSLPITFFDLIWLPHFPINQLFFYEFPHSRTHFIEKVVPNLKHSLSLTLQHFFPFTSNLLVFPKPNDSSLARQPEIRYEEVQVTFYENSGFSIGITNHHVLCDASTKAWTKQVARGTYSTSAVDSDSGFELTGFSDADYADLTTPSRVLSVELNSKVKSWLAGPQRNKTVWHCQPQK